RETEYSGLTRGLTPCGITTPALPRGEIRMAKLEVIVVRETLRESIAKDCITIALFGGMIGLCELLDSAAFQWVWALIALTTTAGLAFRSVAKTNRFTVEQARAKLDGLEARA